MPAPDASELAYVPFVGVAHMMQLVHRIGIEPMLAELAAYIEDDFRRWALFGMLQRAKG